MLRTAQASLDESVFRNPDVLTRGVACFWLAASSFGLGFVVLWSGQSSYLTYFVAAAYAAMLFSWVLSVRSWRDPFNPLSLVLVVGFVRFFLPGILLSSGFEPAEGVPRFFQLMQLAESDWESGHALSLLGILGIVVGWLGTQPKAKQGVALKFHVGGAVRYAGWLGMLVGFLAFWAFVLTNASMDVIASGEFRGTTIQEGTGKYFFLAYLLIAGSVLISCDFLAHGRKWLSLLPTSVAAVLYFILGGRGRAMFALAVGLLVLWYFTAEKRSWRKLSVRPVIILTVPVIAIIVVWLSYLGALYRGGFGSRAFIEALSISGLWEYVQRSIFTDFGQLHSLAGAISIGPGVLNGRTFYGSLTWPLNQFLPIPGKSAGIFIVETLVGFSEGEKWGVNPSLIGDAYLNFGLTTVALLMLLFGALLKIVYVKFRNGTLHIAIYGIALFSALQICFLSIDKWPQALITLVFTYFLILIGNTILQLPHLSPSRWK
jgi:oligosaccharide repeat unit polymerase